MADKKLKCGCVVDPKTKKCVKYCHKHAVEIIERIAENL